MKLHAIQFGRPLGAVLAVLLLMGKAHAEETPSRAFVQPFVAKHCAGCHSGVKKLGKFSFDGLDLKEVAGKQAQAWRQVAERISRGEMPPEDQPRPDSTQANAVVQWVVNQRKKAGLDVAGLGSGPTGNHIDHALLFSGKADAPLENPPPALAIQSRDLRDLGSAKRHHQRRQGTGDDSSGRPWLQRSGRGFDH